MANNLFGVGFVYLIGDRDGESENLLSPTASLFAPQFLSCAPHRLKPTQLPNLDELGKAWQYFNIAGKHPGQYTTWIKDIYIY